MVLTQRWLQPPLSSEHSSLSEGYGGEVGDAGIVQVSFFNTYPPSPHTNHTCEEHSGEARLLHRVIREEGQPQLVGLTRHRRGDGAPAEGAVGPQFAPREDAGQLQTVVVAVLLETGGSRGL